MKYIILTFFLSLNLYAQLPKGFVYVKDEIPTIQIELRYFSDNNFIGKPINGYLANKLILSSKATKSLKLIQKELNKQGLALKVFDAYRPQQAVDHFATWATKLDDTLMKQHYYPNVEKKNLFEEGYIAFKSGHTRGSTLDITLIDLKTGQELDMGSPYDFFGMQSWVAYKNITKKQIQNRQQLQAVMLKHGFKNYPQEWWHFTLKDEPFPDTYFDFEVK